MNGRTAKDGQVLVCFDGLWGSVCDDRWDFRDATVVCRQLGYNGREFSSCCYMYSVVTLTLFLSTSVSYPLFEYNSANDNILKFNIHLDNVDCNGNESTLSECTHRGIGIHNCYEGFEEAGVVCTGECHLI